MKKVVSGFSTIFFHCTLQAELQGLIEVNSKIAVIYETDFKEGKAKFI